MAISFPTQSQTFDINTNVFTRVGPIAGLASSVVASFMVPPGRTFKLVLVEFSGENIAEWIVKVDGSEEGVKRTYYSGPLFGEFAYAGLEVTEEKTVELSVVNKTNETARFEGRILGQLL